ncbi:permease-like cell division protein FtsX [Kineosporia rhizophila]|uniref:permease-like cell division protein FtsX n=1 Tax=Kineosporia TaxID=49184 RepID=UPI000A78DBA6|nr:MULTISPECIES: permease-like cell division protein FtsX [Kineosporia]MCE0534818.1 permease-like cell division protein FtsX [Kineosporia rhizophila]GLY19253.1 cell division protein FtsX [Kineosporia sp. NBRC 101677]
MRFQFILDEILIGLRRNIAMAISVVLVTVVSLFLVGLGFLAQRQVDTMKDYWYDRVQVSIFLCGDVSTAASCADGKATETQKESIQADLNAPQLAQYVEKVYFETQDEAFKRFKEQFKDSALSENVTVDQMPESYRVDLKDPEKYQVVAESFTAKPGVESVESQNQVLDRLFALLNQLKFGAWLLAAVTLVCSVLLVATTIRLTAFTRRRETGIMRLVGASNFFIQLPFILESMIAAAVGAGLASLALVGVTKFQIQDRLAQSLTFTNYVGVGDALMIVPWLFVIGLGIAGVSAFLALQRYLKV